MFQEKERHWITGTDYRVNFTRWRDLLLYRPYNIWLDFRPFAWNIRQEYGEHQMQILYMKIDGPVTIYEILLRVMPADEVSIREWILEQKWILSS
jgi:hypothetical protein